MEMNIKFWTILILLISITIVFLPNVSAKHEILYSYNITLSPVGVTKVNFTTYSDNPIKLLLPPDQSEEIINHALITKENQTYLISPRNIPYSIEYDTTYYAKKEEGIWYFQMPIIQNSSIQINIPKNVQLVKIRPAALIKKNKNITLIWEILNQDQISLSYVFLRQGNPNNQKNSTHYKLPIISTIIIIFSASILFILKNNSKRIKKSVEKIQKNKVLKKVEITNGQLNIIKAVNPNEAKIIEILLKHNNAIKRNQLEKESTLAKSSLASSLKNLEHKNIIIIDRSFSTHFITFSNWFKRL